LYKYVRIYSITHNLLDISHNIAHSRGHDVSYNAQAHSQVTLHVIPILHHVQYLTPTSRVRLDTLTVAQLVL